MTTAVDWSGPVGEVWAAEWRRTDRSFAGLASHLDAAILAAAPASGGRAVDLGCGAGQTSIALAAARRDLSITGVDISTALVGIATARAAGTLPNLRFVQADLAGEAYRFATGADLFFSRHGVMFFARPDAVFADLRAAAAPGTRLVFSCFRASHDNAWARDLVTAVTGAAPPPVDGYAPGPFGFADPDWTAAMLTRAGWHASAPQPVDYRYVAGAGADPVTDAVGFLSRVGPVASAIRAAPDAQRPAMLDRLSAALAERRDGDRVTFAAAAWLWTARAS